MSAVLQWVAPDDVTDDDWEQLALAGDAGPEYERIPQLQIEHALRQQKMHLFRFVPGPGVLLVEVPKGPTGIKRLALLRAAGHGVGWTFPQLAKLLVETAKEWGCEAVETMVYSQRLAMAMQKVGAKTEAVRMVLEVR